ncbi:MAG: hypothetical protein GY950_22705 [bacterium]|nr:hypothetical protein [bacterium]
MPPKIRLENLKNFDIKDENIVSFKKVGVEVPFLSLFSKVKKVNINLHNPVILLNEKILKKGKKKTSGKLPFEIDRINVIDGELIYNSSKMIVNLLKVNLNSFNRSGKSMYKLRSPHLKFVMRTSKNVDLLQFPDIDDEVVKNNKLFKIEGDMICEFRAQPTNWKISRFLWNTADSRITINGRVFKSGTLALNATFHGTPEKILYPILKNLRPLGYMEAKVHVKRKKKEPVFVEGEIGYNTFSLAGENFDNLRGTVKWNTGDRQLEVDTFFNDQTLQSRLKVIAKPGLTRLEGVNMYARRATRIVKIHGPVPVGGIIKQADVDLNKGIISGTVKLASLPPDELSNAPVNGDFSGDEPGAETTPLKDSGLFNFDGEVTFRYNSKFKSVHFSTAGAKAEFGTVHFLEGYVDPTRETNLHIKAGAAINKMGQINKYTRYYIDLDLSQWNLRKGEGPLDLDVKKTGKKFFVESDMDIRNFTSNRQPIEFMKGHISTEGSITTGEFTITDKEVNGTAKLSAGKGFFTIDFKKVAGESRKVLNILGIDISLTRWMTGDFHLHKKSGESFPLVTGNFQAKRINFYDFYFDDVTGELEFKGHTTLKNLRYRYNDGKGSADIFIDYSKDIYSIEGEIKGVNINRLHPEFHGKGDIFFKGEGVIDHDPIKFNYNTGDLFFYEGRKFTANGTGEILTDFSGFRIDTQGNVVNAVSSSPFTFRLNQQKNIYSGSIHLKLNDINLLIPWGNNNGTMDLKAQIFDSGGEELSTEGHAEFEGRIFSFPNFPHALENFRGDVMFKDLSFTLRSLQGSLGGGKVRGSGYLDVKENRLEDLFISFTGKKMNVYAIDRTNFVMDADLSLKYMEGKLLISGQMNALSGIWKREIDEGVSFNTDPSLSPSGSKIMDMLEFDLKLTGNDNIRMENSFGSIMGKFDLRLTGNKNFPVLMGFIECRKGEINFSDRKFDLIKAKLVFNNKFTIDPLLNVESESFIKNYRIKFNIKGTASRLKPELQSSPPLPPRDILTLISLGELFQRPTSAELTSRVGTGTAGLIASGLTDQIKKRTKKIFGNYMLKIDPNISVSSIAGASFEKTSRLIVGKEVTRDLLVVYATNFSAKPMQVIYLQYQLSPSLSLVGMRNENSQFSLDLRFRKRL